MAVLGFRCDPPPRFEAIYEPAGVLAGWQIRDTVTGTVTHAGGKGEEEMRAMLEVSALMNKLPADEQDRIVANHLAVKLD
jgi:hypothetical protein